MKKVFIGFLTSILLIGLVGCGDSFKEGVKDGMDAAKTDSEEKVEETSKETSVDLNKLDTKEDIDKAYLDNMSKIKAKEQIKELDMNNIKLDTVKEYANNASKKVDGLNLKGTEAIDVIDKLAVLDDLDHNTSQDVLKESIKYIVDEYKAGKIFNADEVKANMYICRYIDKRIIRNHPNMKNEEKVVIDLYQMCKDTIRGDNSSMDANKKQVEDGLKKINY